MNTLNTQKIKTSDDVIASSPWTTAEGLKPSRIVIRNLGANPIDNLVEYVVHEEILNQETMETWFNCGDYTHDIEVAWDYFTERATRSIKKVTVKERRYDPYLKRFVEGKSCADKNEYHHLIGRGQ